jgi:hypothetical protein
VLVVSLCLLAVGCGKSKEEKLVHSKEMEQDLKRLGIAYHALNEATKKGPAKADDLAPYLENDQRLLDLLKSRQIVFDYDVPLHKIIAKSGTSETILAYPRDSPALGGWFLMADGSVKKMTTDEFNKAPKAWQSVRNQP